MKIKNYFIKKWKAFSPHSIKNYFIQTWKAFLHSIKNIVKDLLHLKWYEYLFLSLSGAFLITTGLFDLINLKWVWEDKAIWKGVVGVFAGLAAWTGIVCVFLIGKGKVSNYIYGIINNILYGIYAFSVAYTGDALLNLLFFLPMEFVGLYLWNRNLNKDETVKVNKFGWKQFIIYFLIACALFAGFWYLIPVTDEWLHHDVIKDNNDPYAFANLWVPHALDAFTNSLSIVAMILMLKAYKEQWYVWIIINIAQIAMYAGVNGWGVNIPMIVMWLVFLINAVYSLIHWFKLEKLTNK